MFAAAGIVVTEMSTPMSAPDFAVVRESIPATPGAERDEEARKSGLEMSSASPWSSSVKVSGATPGRLEDERREPAPR